MEFGSLIVVVLTSVGAFVLGWQARVKATSGQEAELKRAMYESKGAIPQLEAAVRAREQRISNYQSESEQLRGRITNLEATLSQKESELLKRDRDLRRVTSELAIAKEGGRAESLHPEIEMVDGESADTEPVAVDDARYRQLEARFEALKRGLITRDDRITELEAELSKSPASGLAAQVDALNDAARDHGQSIAAKDATIKALEARLVDEADQRVQLETLAKRRTETNRELKEKLFKFEAQLPKLMDTLTAKNDIIGKRDATIKELSSALAAMTAERDARDGAIVQLNAEVVQREERVAALDARAGGLEQRIKALTADLTANKLAQSRAEQTIVERDSAIATITAKLEALAATASQQDRAIESLKGTIRDREFRIDSLTGDLAKLTAELDTARADATAHAAMTAAPESNEVPSDYPESSGVPSAGADDGAGRELREAMEKIDALGAQNAALNKEVAAYARKLEALDRERTEQTARISQLEAADGQETRVLESQLADARRRAERAEEELLEIAQQAKALRERIAGLEAPPAEEPGSAAAG